MSEHCGRATTPSIQASIASGVDGSDISDLYRSCETVYDAFPDLPSVDAIHCDASDDPLHEW